MSKQYQITVFCECGHRHRYLGDPDEQPTCPECGSGPDRDKLARATAALRAFEADPVKQAAIREIQAAADRGEDPLGTVEDCGDAGNARP
jgi:hypothetical protein